MISQMGTWPGTAQTEEKTVLDKAGVDMTEVAEVDMTGVKLEAARTVTNVRNLGTYPN